MNLSDHRQAITTAYENLLDPQNLPRNLDTEELQYALDGYWEAVEVLSAAGTNEDYKAEWGFAVDAVTTVPPWGYKWEAVQDFYYPEFLPIVDDNESGKPLNPEVHAEWIEAATRAVTDWRNETGEFLGGRGN